MQKKAFDIVDHNYLQGVLEEYVFGPKCKNWLKLLSKNLKANILENGFTTENRPLVLQMCILKSNLNVLH